MIEPYEMYGRFVLIILVPSITLVPLQVVVALGGSGNGFPRQDGFDITVASEVRNLLVGSYFYASAAETSDSSWPSSKS